MNVGKKLSQIRSPSNLLSVGIIPIPIRCNGCGTVLAMLDETGLVINRGDQQNTIEGTFRAFIVCHKPRCRKLNIINHSTERKDTAGLMDT